MTGALKVINSGRTLAYTRVELSDDAGKLLAYGSERQVFPTCLAQVWTCLPPMNQVTQNTSGVF
jgi:hypothetical protein